MNWSSEEFGTKEVTIRVHFGLIPKVYAKLFGP